MRLTKDTEWRDNGDRITPSRIRLELLHEAGYWTVPKKKGKGRYSFLLGGIKDRKRFMKKMNI